MCTRNKIAGILLAAFLLAGLFAALHVSASTNFDITKINTGYTDNVIPLQLSTRLTAVTENATSDITLVWQVNDPSVATIDQNGVLKPLKAGKVKVTVTARGKGTGCDITIVNAQATLDSDLTQVVCGEKLQMKAKLQLDENVISLSGRQMNWTVTGSHASVDADGILSGTETETVTVTAALKSTPDVRMSREIRIVKGYVNITIDGTDFDDSPDSNEVRELSFILTPDITATVTYMNNDDQITWSCLQPGKAEIIDTTNVNTPDHEYTALIQFQDSGDVTIRAAIKSDPSIYKDYFFKVNPYKSELSDLVDDAIFTYESDNYSTYRWNNYMKSLLTAKDVLGKENATQKELLAAQKALEEAIAQLNLEYMPVAAGGSGNPDNTGGAGNETQGGVSSSEASSESGASSDAASGGSQNDAGIGGSSQDGHSSTPYTQTEPEGSFPWKVVINIAVVVVVAGGAVAVIAVVNKKGSEKPKTDL